MTDGTATLRRKHQMERTIRTSMLGNGREHTHVILSKSRGLDRVIAVATFDDARDAATRADKVKAEFERMGFTGRTTWAGTVLELVKAGETKSFLFTRHCTLRHNIDG
jgi:hypothetical protein